jgi:hypothetical protein
MPRKKKPAPEAVANDQNDVFATEGAQATAEVPAPAPGVGEEKQERGGGYTGVIRVLPDGTKAHYRDHGNRSGVEISFEFPDEKDRPGGEVTEPLKEAHQGADNMQWTGEIWHKDVAGYSPKHRRFRHPKHERLDAEGRYETAVDRLAESRKPKEEGRSV